MQQTESSSRLDGAGVRLAAISFGTLPATVILMAFVGLAVLAAGAYAAPALAAYGLALLGLGIPSLLLLWHRPEFGLLALILLASSLVPTTIVDVRLPIGGGLDLQDLVLVGLFGIVGLRELIRRKPIVPWWPVGGPLLLFLLMAVFSAGYALFVQGVEANWALNDLRILALYTTFFIVLWSSERPNQLEILLIGLFVIADLTTTVIYAQQIVGAGNPLLEAMTTSRDWRVYQGSGAVRVIPAGHVLMHFMWFVALGLLAFAGQNRRLRVFSIAQLLFIGGGHLLTYTRAQWVAMVIGLGLAGITLMPRYRQHLAKTAVVAVCIVLLLAGGVAGGALSNVAATPFVAGIVERFGTLLSPSETSGTQSLQWRDFEVEKASLALKDQPLTGVGLGNRYRSLSTFTSEASGSVTGGNIAAGRVSRFTRYVHNSYVSIAVKMGIPALTVLLWFCASALFNGFRRYVSMPDSLQKGVILGILAGFVGLLFWSYFHAHLIKAESVGVIALMVGLVGSQVTTRGPTSRYIWDRQVPPKG